MENNYFDIYYHNEKNHRFCYRSGDMVYEEVFEGGALLSAGWNASGYPLNVLKNCPSYLNPKRYAEPFAFNIELDGQSVDFGLEFVDFKTEKSEENETSVLTLKSNIKPVNIKIHTLIDSSQMLSRWLEIENLSETPLKLNKLSVMSGGIESLDDDALENTESVNDVYSLGYFENDGWGKEGQFKWEALKPNCTSIDGRFKKDRFRHPLLFIRNNLTGKIWFSQIGFSGGYRYTVDYNARPDKCNTHLSFKAEITGHNPIYVIAPKGKFVSLVVYMGLVQGNIDDAINEMHSHIRKSVLNMPEAEGKTALIGCGMGAEHTMNVEDSKAFIDQFALMGGEAFIIDAGWECPPDEQMDWSSYNGRNIPDKDRYPNGIKELRDYAHSKGLKFGLWVDIESVGKYCAIHQKHPEWRTVNALGEKSGKFLDLSIPECAEWCKSELTRIISEYELDLLRVDHNVDYTEYFGMRDTGFGIPECVCVKHNEAVYKMYESLKKSFPDVIFENCAGGGGRTDLGMMKNFNHTWVSDWQKMPRSIAITNGMTMALPPERVDRLFAGMGCHTIGSFDAHLRNTMLGHISLNVISPAGAEINQKQMAFIKHSTDIYKEFIRPFLAESKIYHHTPDLNESDYSVLEISAPDKSRGAITVITLCGTNEKEITVKPKGINISKEYQVTLDNEGFTYTILGEKLKRNGICVDIKSSLSSELILYKAI
ncbi:MAG: alpha-galactosidase [Clostridia bacterium]|nr:alpha-galactosidase [Clostridia bacterium]